MKVYVVTAGSYSDYHIEGVFSDTALAESFAAELKRVTPDYSRNAIGVDERDVDARIEERAAPMYLRAIELETGDLFYSNEYGEMLAPNQRIPVKQYDPITNWSNNCGQYTLCAVGQSYVSAEYALKLAAEHRQAWLRNRATLPPETTDAPPPPAPASPGSQDT